MNHNGVIAVMLAALAFAAVRWLLRLRPVKTRVLAFCLAALAAVPALLTGLYYFHVLPQWAWFYELRSWPGTEFLVIFLGGAAGAATTLLPRRLLEWVAIATAIVAVVLYIKPVIGPLPDSTFKDSWQDGVCMQSTPSTCGPASVCTLLKQFGITTTERTVARAAYSYAGGTEAWYLARYIRRQGLVPHFDFRNTFTPEAGWPAMVGVRVEGFGHFIAVLDVTGGQVTYADPMEGRQRLPFAEFQKHYQFTGFQMVICKP